MNKQTNEIFNTADVLPEEGKLVLGYVNYDNWDLHSDDSGKVYWEVVYLERGITNEERRKLSDDNNRKHTLQKGDVNCGNHVPYCWLTVGPSSFKGQDITRWCHLPDPPNKQNKAPSGE